MPSTGDPLVLMMGVGLLRQQAAFVEFKVRIENYLNCKGVKDKDRCNHFFYTLVKKEG